MLFQQYLHSNLTFWSAVKVSVVHLVSGTNASDHIPHLPQGIRLQPEVKSRERRAPVCTFLLLNFSLLMCHKHCTSPQAAPRAL